MPLPPLSRLEALGLASDEPVPDVFLVVADRDFHGASLSVLTELRSNPETRHSMVMMVLPGFAIDDSAIALDLGADDLVMDGFNPDELALRLNALVQRKRQNDALRARVKDGLKAAVIDPLTGLYNRRYAISHLARVAETSTETGKSFAVMLLDLDHFKQINDTYGHAVGDDVITNRNGAGRNFRRTRQIFFAATRRHMGHPAHYRQIGQTVKFKSCQYKGPVNDRSNSRQYRTPNGPSYRARVPVQVPQLRQWSFAEKLSEIA